MPHFVSEAIKGTDVAGPLLIARATPRQGGSQVSAEKITKLVNENSPSISNLVIFYPCDSYLSSCSGASNSGAEKNSPNVMSNRRRAFDGHDNKCSSPI